MKTDKTAEVYDNSSMTYVGTGVDYEAMDPHKRASADAAKLTYHWLERLGLRVVPWTCGESVTVIETPHEYLGLVVEGLGTKILVADALFDDTDLTGAAENAFDAYIAQCNVAMAFNDLITLGLRPIAYNQYLAAGDSARFKMAQRMADLIFGTGNACDLARCAWTGGETPTLPGIIYPKALDLAGATMGIIQKKEQLINPANIRTGDAIFILESSGIHANALSLARRVAAKVARRHDPLWRRMLRMIYPRLPVSAKALAKAYMTKLSDGRCYGESLLQPTHIYVQFIEDCLDAGINIHYCINVTGHGFRKFMRAPQKFTYVIERPPKPHPVFGFIQENGNVTDEEMYGNCNMGAGFAIYVSADDLTKVTQLMHDNTYPFRGHWAGYILEGEKKVTVPTKNLTFRAESLAIR